MQDSPTHLLLEVRPHTEMPYSVEGDFQGRIARFHASPDAADAAIHAHCRARGCTATVRVYTPRNRPWREDEVNATGEVVRTTPIWRRPTTGIPTNGQ